MKSKPDQQVEHSEHGIITLRAPIGQSGNWYADGYSHVPANSSSGKTSSHP
jgi:hypothetical protein